MNSFVEEEIIPDSEDEQPSKRRRVYGIPLGVSQVATSTKLSWDNSLDSPFRQQVMHDLSKGIPSVSFQSIRALRDDGSGSDDLGVKPLPPSPHNNRMRFHHESFGETIGQLIRNERE